MDDGSWQRWWVSNFLAAPISLTCVFISQRFDNEQEPPPPLSRLSDTYGWLHSIWYFKFQILVRPRNHFMNTRNWTHLCYGLIVLSFFLNSCFLKIILRVRMLFLHFWNGQGNWNWKRLSCPWLSLFILGKMQILVSIWTHIGDPWEFRPNSSRLKEHLGWILVDR